jgi:hypothetical protein
VSRASRYLPAALLIAGVLALFAELEALATTLHAWRLAALSAIAGALAGFFAARRLAPLRFLAMRQERWGFTLNLVLGSALLACGAASALNRSAPPEPHVVHVDVRGLCTEDRRNFRGYYVYFAWQDGVEWLSVPEDVWSRMATGREALDLVVHPGRLGFTVVDDVRPVRSSGTPPRIACSALDP